MDESKAAQFELRETGDRHSVGVWFRADYGDEWFLAGILERDALRALLPYARALTRQLPLRAEIRLAEDE